MFSEVLSMSEMEVAQTEGQGEAKMNEAVIVWTSLCDNMILLTSLDRLEYLDVVRSKISNTIKGEVQLRLTKGKKQDAAGITFHSTAFFGRLYTREANSTLYIWEEVILNLPEEIWFI